MAGAGIHNLASEDFNDPQDFMPVFRGGSDADEGHLSLNGLLSSHVPQFEHVYQSPQIFHDLLKHVRVGPGCDGNPRHLRIGRRRTADCFDIIAAAGKKPGHPRGHTRLVFHQHC